jgi:hypothetical protein
LKTDYGKVQGLIFSVVVFPRFIKNSRAFL